MPNIYKPPQGLITELITDPNTRQAFDMVNKRLNNLESSKLKINRQFSDPCPSLTVSNNSGLIDVPNLNLGIKSSGNPVFLGLQFSPAAFQSGVTLFASNLSNNGVINTGIVIVRIDSGGNSVVGQGLFYLDNGTGAGMPTMICNPTQVYGFDTMPAGAYNYKVQVAITPASSQLIVEGVQLVAYEL